MEDKDIERELSGKVFLMYPQDNPPPTETAEEAIKRIGDLVGLWAEADKPLPW